jgi:hypothetical protein
MAPSTSPAAFLRAALGAALFAAAAAQGSLSHKGMGTAYSAPGEMDATGQNMCEFNPSSLPEQFQRNFAAMNQADWDSGNCGKCIKACGAKGCVVAMIVDQCPEWACDKGNVDFSTAALEAATGYDWDKKPITWDYVSCSDGGLTEEEQAAKDEAAAAKKAAAAKAAAAKQKAELAAMSASVRASAISALSAQSAFSDVVAAGATVDAQAAVDASAAAQAANAAALAANVGDLAATANEAVDSVVEAYAALQAAAGAAATPAPAPAALRKLML